MTRSSGSGASPWEVVWTSPASLTLMQSMRQTRRARREVPYQPLPQKPRLRMLRWVTCSTRSRPVHNRATLSETARFDFPLIWIP